MITSVPSASNVPFAAVVSIEGGDRSGDADESGGIGVGAGANANRMTRRDYETASFGPRLFGPLPALESRLREKESRLREKGRRGYGDGVGAGANVNRLTRRDYETATFGPRSFAPLPALESRLREKESRLRKKERRGHGGGVGAGANVNRMTVRRTRDAADGVEMEEVLASTTVWPHEDEEEDGEEEEEEDELLPPTLEKGLCLWVKGKKRILRAMAVVGAVVGIGVALGVVFGTRRQPSPFISETPSPSISETTNAERSGSKILEQCVLDGEDVHCRPMPASITAETRNDGDERTKDGDGLFLCVDSDPRKTRCRAWIKPFEFPVAAADDVVRGRRGRRQQQQGKRRAAISTPVNQVGACCETCAPCPEGCEREWAFDCSDAISGVVGGCGDCREEDMPSLPPSLSPLHSLSPSPLQIASPTLLPSPPSRPPSTETTPRPTGGEKVAEEEKSRLARAIAAASSVSSSEALSDPTSPQSRALSWLVSEDTYPFKSYSAPTDSDGNGKDDEDDYFVVQRYVMALMYFAWDGPNWVRSTNYLSVEISECDWFGLTCGNIFSGAKGKITHISYGKRIKLKGPFLEELTALVHLQEINLPNNEIGGSLPEALARLKRLKVLGLGGNHITGIPDSLGEIEELEELHLSGNRIKGTVPPSLGLLAKLETLDLSENRLSGLIPPSLGDLKALEFLDLSYNYLEGTVPTSLKNLTSLGIAIDS